MATGLLRLRRLATILGTAGVLSLAGTAPAWATSTSDIHLNPHQKGKTATAFENSCGQIPGGAKAGLDGWVFVLPGNSGTLRSLDITFNNGTTNVRIHIPDASSPYPNGIATNGSDKGYVVVPSGWTVVDGTGRADNPKGDTFNVTHVCRGGGGTTESSPSKSPSPSAGSGGGGSTNGGSEGGPSRGPGGGTGGGSAGETGSLPITGTAVGGLVALGLGLVGAGTVLMVLRRRREAVTFEA
jgi:LPXTG-motif cell wall-anchored protein